jgi:hypothetical protein
MKALIAGFLLTMGMLAQDVNSPLPYSPGQWLLSYRIHGLDKTRRFEGKSAAIDWIERDKPYYLAVRLKHNGVLYPCKTFYDSTVEYGKLAHHKNVACYSKAEEEEFQRRTPPSPGGGWTVN